MARGRGYVQNAQTRLNRARARQGAGRGGRGRGKAGASSMPWDSQAQRESAELGNEGADTRASLASGYDRAQRDLGFGTGAGDPYSATAENKTQLTNAARGITNTAGNQLYAGSTANAQSAARTSYDKQQKGLENTFADAQTDFNRGTAQATRDEQLGVLGIKEGALNRAAASEPAPLGVGRGRGSGRGRGVQEGRNVRRPAQARALNAQARRINARGRGRI